jgi:hypothetical protein
MQQSQPLVDDDEPSSNDVAAAEELASLAVRAGSNGGRDAHALYDRFRVIVRIRSFSNPHVSR